MAGACGPCTQKVQPTQDETNSTEQGRNATESKIDICSEFAEYTTLHGVHFLSGPYSKPRRLLWLVFIVAGLVGLLVQLYYGVSRFHSKGIILSKGAESLSDVPFPAVTICNHNMMMKTKINGTDAQRYLDQQDKLKIQSGRVNVTDEVFDIEELVRKYGHTINDMMKVEGFGGCLFKSLPCTGANFSTFTSFTNGLCYTFNAGHGDSQVLRVDSAGASHSLKLNLHVMADEYYGPYSYNLVGFKIVVHDQNHFPQMEEEAYDIAPGFYTNIRVRRKKETFLPAPYPTACSEKRLSYYKTYSTSFCKHECETRITLKYCGCRLLGMAPLKEVLNARFCTAREIRNCVLWLTRYEGSRHRSTCDCPTPCLSYSYSVQPSLGYFPSPSIMETLYNVSPKDKTRFMEEARLHVLSVSIYYETDVLEEKPEYSLSTFASEVGGNMGLFLGCSILTIMEFFDLVFRLCFACLFRK